MTLRKGGKKDDTKQRSRHTVRTRYPSSRRTWSPDHFTRASRPYASPVKSATLQLIKDNIIPLTREWPTTKWVHTSEIYSELCEVWYACIESYRPVACCSNSKPAKRFSLYIWVVTIVIYNPIQILFTNIASYLQRH